MTTQFKLEEHEINSPLWQKLKKHYETKLESLRVANDSIRLGEIETAILRGKIREVRNILSIDKINETTEE